MKLFFCPICDDVHKLSTRTRKCRCGASWGRYHRDLVHATIGGHAVPLGFENTSFVNALLRRPHEGTGVRFTAFVIPEHDPHVTVDSTPCPMVE